MYNPTLIYGNINENKCSDLSNYLKTLHKKQSEIKAKYGNVDKEANSEKEEEDSDLASLAREFGEDLLAESRFLKKKAPSTPSSACSLLEDKIPFISTKLSSKQTFKAPQNSNALDNFMKFDLKYAESFKNLKNDEQLSEFTEPTSSEEIQKRQQILKKEDIIPSPEVKSQKYFHVLENDDKSLSSTSSRFISLLKKRAGKQDLRLNISKCTEADIESHALDTLSHITNTISPIHVIEEFDEDQINEEEVESILSDKSKGLKTDEIVEVISINESSYIELRIASDNKSDISSTKNGKSLKVLKESSSTSTKSVSKTTKSSSNSKVSEKKKTSFLVKTQDGRKKHKKPPKRTKTSSKVDQYTQVELPRKEYIYGHYLFNPTLDMNYYSQDGTYLSETYLNSANHVINDMLKNQLDLTKNFLDSQKHLYLNYCQSLEDMVKAFNSRSSIKHPSSKIQQSDQFEDYLPSCESKRELTSESYHEGSSSTLIASVDNIENNYESDFESDTGSTVKNNVNMSISTMEANHAFTAVDLDAVLDEFEFHEGEAERQCETSKKKGNGNISLKESSSGIFSPTADEENEDQIDVGVVGGTFWESNAHNLCESQSPVECASSPPKYDAAYPSDENGNDRKESDSSPSSSSSEEDEEEGHERDEDNGPACPSSSSSLDGSQQWTECSPPQEDVRVPDDSGGARPKMTKEDAEEVPLDSPPPYSEIDPMKQEDEGEEIRKLNRPTSLALPPPPLSSSNRTDEVDSRETSSVNPSPSAVTEDSSVSPAALENPVMGPPGSTPAIPNVSLVPDLLQGLSEEQLVLGKVSPWWVPDSDALTCMICDIKFTLTKRRHHCRACGKVLCNHCCLDRFNLAYMDNKEARVCKPCKGILERLKRTEEMNNNESDEQNERGHIAPINVSAVNSSFLRPNPSNPMEYCSTVPPLQQVAASGGATANRPSVMVPVGVLKRWDNVSSPDRRVSTESKQVMFSDGIRPGGDLTELDGSPEHRSLNRIPRPSHKSSSRRAGQSDVARSMLPLEGMPYVSGVGLANPVELVDSFHKGQSIAFSINRNLRVHVSLRFYTPANNHVWSYRTEGLNSVANDEIVFLLIQKDSTESLPPRDIFDHIQKLFEQARKGSSVHEMSHSVVLSGTDFLDGSDYGGFLFIRRTFQCLQGLDLPDPPFLFALLITKTEVPWARVFPLRLMLRLGAESRYYPSPLWSYRNRNSVYKESGNTIMKILSDFRNFTYSLPIIKGMVVHVEDKVTAVLLPKNRYKLVQKALQNSNDPVLALGANFSTVADSHYVAVQRMGSETPKNPTSSSDYETQTINISNRPRKVTGASFIVFNGALKSSSGLTAKSSIVEDGIMVQVGQDKMMEIRKKLYAMEDTEVGCGAIGSSQPDEIVSIRWVEDDRTINTGIKSPIDNSPMDGIISVRIHSGPDFHGDGHLIRCTEIFFFPSECGEDNVDSADSSKVAEFIAKSVCQALTPHLKSLRNKNDIGVLGVRITLDPENVGYDAGGKGQPLSSEFMNSLDNELIPIIHSQSIPRRTKFELIFHILNT
ncbi:uncharacterized protein Sara [Lepeophtheirus salmonis]|uniref:uncharacterized protein Sara n=1 Tax=Lepeophtheirus salmonis TaxID=72036 RepID=UPI003AF3CAA0